MPLQIGFGIFNSNTHLPPWSILDIKHFLKTC